MCAPRRPDYVPPQNKKTEDTYKIIKKERNVFTILRPVSLRMSLPVQNQTPQQRDELRHLPERSWRDGDLGRFMEAASPLILSYCRRRLSRDPDLIGDFYVHFYERAHTCLEKFRSRVERQTFTGYLCTYVRHEFFNYLRTRRHQAVDEIPAPEIFGLAGAAKPQASHPSVSVRLYDSIDELPLESRLPLKLYYGLEPGLEELRALVETSGSAARSAELLDLMRRRRRRMEARLQCCRDRIAYLSRMIHRSPGDHPRQPDWKRWKQRLHTRLERDRPVLTLAEIAGLLRISKSTALRRIRRCGRSLRNRRDLTGL